MHLIYCKIESVSQPASPPTVAATHRETQQFYNMYNTLADTRTYMDKELSLLNSILDNMAA